MDFTTFRHLVDQGHLPPEERGKKPIQLDFTQVFQQVEPGTLVLLIGNNGEYATTPPKLFEFQEMIDNTSKKRQNSQFPFFAFKQIREKPAEKKNTQLYFYILQLEESLWEKAI